MAIFALCACEKMAVETVDEFATISFTTTVGEGYAMTKSVSNADFVREALAAATPGHVQLKLTKLSNGNEIIIRSNETKSVPMGEYKVELYKKEGDGGSWCYSDIPIGSSNPSHRGWNNWCDNGNEAFNQNPFFKYPLFKMASFNVNITNDCNIKVPLSYDCSAIVFDNEKSATKHKINEIGSREFCVFKYENLSIMFIKNSNKRVTIDMEPKAGFENLEKRTYTFNPQNLEKGKFYFLECYECGKSETVFSLETDEWGQGEI